MSSSWIYQDNDLTDIPTGYIGFVYLITNKLTNKKYIGKKNFYFSKTIQKNKKKKRVKIESDWKDYYGSNKTLQEEVSLNKENYIREILYLCKTKSECSYFEAYEQFNRNVLLSDEYYNDWISCKITRVHMKSTVSNKSKIH